MKRALLLVAVLVAVAGTGLDCKRAGDYTVLVDRDDSMDVTAGGYTGEGCDLQAGDALRAEFSVLHSAGPVDFLVLSDSNLAEWEARRQYSAVIEVEDAAAGEEYGTIPADGRYWLLVSNRDDGNAPRKVFYEVWRRKR